MSALCNRSTRHLSHLSKTLSSRFLKSSVVSLSFVQILFDFDVLWVGFSLAVFFSRINASDKKNLIALNIYNISVVWLSWPPFECLSAKECTSDHF